MLDQATLTAGLERLRARLEPDITDRAEEEPSIAADLRQRYEAARAAKRTGLSFELWRAGEVTQAAVAWLLACVFVRFLEDNHLIEQPWISGPANRLAEAKEQNLSTYRAGQWKTDRDYLLLCFEEIRKLPGVSSLFETEHNPLFRLTPTGNGARAIIDFFQKPDDHGNLIHDFSGTIDNTRFLGDIYQNISESARKRYALVQTPDFVVDFILDRTMEPALQEFGLEGFRLIDPACGSGHFLIAAFERLFHKWQKHLPPIDPIDCAKRALASVYGVDLNPFAIAIARFRLLVYALRLCETSRLTEAPDFRMNLAVGDSLLHGTRPGTSGDVQRHAFDESLNFFYETEDKDKLREYLKHGSYQAVVANPPYIGAQDRPLKDVYRDRFGSCSGAYQLSVPFTERTFELAVPGSRAGFVGLITSNAFMKRSSGRRFVLEFIPRWDISHVIDSWVADPDGHGTPTVILFGRNRLPSGDSVRVLRGIKRAASSSSNAGPAWAAILDQVDRDRTKSAYVSSADTPRSALQSHPWNMGGGGAAELKDRIGQLSTDKLEAFISDVGRTTHTGEDAAFFLPVAAAKTFGISDYSLPLVDGERIRHYLISGEERSIFPYSKLGGIPLANLPLPLLRRLWPLRTSLSSRRDYGKTVTERGLKWYEHSMFFPERFRAPTSIAFSFVSTHNQFALDRSGRLFNRTAPALKLAASADESTHVELLGVLNSSTATFWLRQMCFPKDGSNEWFERFEFDAGKVSKLPLPARLSSEFGFALQQSADRRTAFLPETNILNEVPSLKGFQRARRASDALCRRMIALQEELDWHVYHLYTLTKESVTLSPDQVPDIDLGQRAFEIVMARQMANGELETEWFNRHGSTPVTEIPTEWPAPYRQLVQKRIDIIASDRDIALIEQPEYKRRWNLPKWEDLEIEALRNWLLDRLEDARYWPADPPMLRTVSNLASAAAEDPDFRQVAELYTGRSDFKLDTLVAELVEKQSIPFLSILRYKGLGLTKRKQWEETWDLQRREDAGEKLSIDVPPKYEKIDFLTDTGWRLRGKLDVPKERWVSYPHLNRISDSTLLIGWAGYDHAQQAFALAAFYQNVKEDGSAPSRLVPILAGILDLLPWVKQWHNAPDPATGIQAGDFLDEFLRNEVSSLNLTEGDLRNWTPPAPQKSPRAARTVKEKRS